MSPHAETALDQLRLAQEQLRHLDDTAETPAHQLMVFAAGAVVHAVLALRADQDETHKKEMVAAFQKLRADTCQERADRMAIGLMRLRDEINQVIREDREVENGPPPG